MTEKYKEQSGSFDVSRDAENPFMADIVWKIDKTVEAKIDSRLLFDQTRVIDEERYYLLNLTLLKTKKTTASHPE